MLVVWVLLRGFLHFRNHLVASLNLHVPSKRLHIFSWLCQFFNIDVCKNLYSFNCSPNLSISSQKRQADYRPNLYCAFPFCCKACFSLWFFGCPNFSLHNLQHDFSNAFSCIHFAISFSLLYFGKLTSSSMMFFPDLYARWKWSEIPNQQFWAIQIYTLELLM